MRRHLGLALLAALGLALLVSPGAENPMPQLGADRAAAADCVWKRHVKRVVKRVKRHGRVRRVVKRRVRWTCAPPATPAVVAAPAPVAPTPPAAGPDPEPEANRLAVKAGEFYFVLSRPSVRAGAVTIELNNQGEDPHNLNLRPEGDEGEPLELPETDSEQRSVESFDLPAGRYELWCSLPGHEENGMATTLQVG
ncbi:MAG TPA: hypothetical protein VNR67_07645 [Solirubrobacterales bacterium]|nr:hypothetical protein [Solirubrobacterales bacterium]